MQDAPNKIAFTAYHIEGGVHAVVVKAWSPWSAKFGIISAEKKNGSSVWESVGQDFRFPSVADQPATRVPAVISFEEGLRVIDILQTTQHSCLTRLTEAGLLAILSLNIPCQRRECCVQGLCCK